MLRAENLELKKQNELNLTKIHELTEQNQNLQKEVQSLRKNATDRKSPLDMYQNEDIEAPKIMKVRPYEKPRSQRMARPKFEPNPCSQSSTTLVK